MLDPNTKQSKGLAYVSFVRPEAAVAAYDALDKTSFQGRLLHILPAVDRKGKVEEADNEGKKRTLKQDREAKRKAGAGKEFNWAMLYMNVRLVAVNISGTGSETPPCIERRGCVIDCGSYERLQGGHFEPGVRQRCCETRPRGDTCHTRDEDIP